VIRRRTPPTDSGLRWKRSADLRRDVRALLRSLEIDAPLDIRELCARLGEHRGRRIRLHALPTPAGLTGLWYPDERQDWIVFQSLTTSSHQTQIILHEIGHIISGHPLLEIGLAARALAREPIPGTYSDPLEQEAEMVATVIKEWVTVLEHLNVRVSSSDSPAARRLHNGFGSRQGWL
jgi:hypothetical protein